MDANELETSIKFFDEKIPFSRNQVNNLGKYFAGKKDSPPADYLKILSWYRELANHTIRVVSSVVSDCIGDERFQHDVVVSSRIKTRATAGDKVRGGLQLWYVQDFAGVRFDMDILHPEALRIAEGIVALVSSEDIEVKIKNYLEKPQQGYRAVHVWVQSRNAGRVEIQLRTKLQSAWANAFEKAADITGRRIRYESDYEVEEPWLADIVDQLWKTSLAIYESESSVAAAREDIREAHRALEEAAWAVPADEQLHLARSELYQLLAGTEKALAKVAISNSNLVEKLDRLANSLAAYSRVSAEGKEEE